MSLDQQTLQAISDAVKQSNPPSIWQNQNLIAGLVVFILGLAVSSTVAFFKFVIDSNAHRSKTDLKIDSLLSVTSNFHTELATLAQQFSHLVSRVSFLEGMLKIRPNSDFNTQSKSIEADHHE